MGAKLRTALFWVITHQVVVISYQCFRATYWSHPQGSRIQKESWMSQNRVHIEKSGGSEKFSVVWC